MASKLCPEICSNLLGSLYLLPGSPQIQPGCLPGLCSGESILIEAFLTRHKLVAQSCPTLFDPMNYSPPGSSVHGIFQARLLEWVAISFSRGSS